MYFALNRIYIYICSLRVLRRRAPQKDRKIKEEAAVEKIGGRNSVRITVGGISTFSNVLIIFTITKRE
jgi:hypothetical protein